MKTRRRLLKNAGWVWLLPSSSQRSSMVAPQLTKDTLTIACPAGPTPLTGIRGRKLLVRGGAVRLLPDPV